MTCFLRRLKSELIFSMKMCYFSGDVEHTHLVKGLDFALLHKVRSEMEKKPDVEDEIDGNSR